MLVILKFITLALYHPITFQIMTLYPKLILDALATVRYPGTGKNLVEAEMVADNLRIESMKVSFSLIFEKPTDPFMKSVIKAAEAAIHT